MSCYKEYGFQERLLEAMQRKGFTEAQLVKSSRIKKSTLNQWTRGIVKHPVAGEDLRELVDLLGVSADWLLWGKGTYESYQSA
jgi:transcriptional regulator with XRE-family HTH domain